MTVHRQLLLVDYGGVLVESPLKAICRFSNDYKLDCKEVADLVFGTQEHDGPDHPWKLLEKDAINFAEYRRQFTALAERTAVNIPCPSLQQIYDLRTNTSLIEWLQTLHNSSFVGSIGIATNNVRQMRSRWRQQVCASRFDVVFDSSQLRVRKPEAKFFDCIATYAEASGIAIEDIYLVDDVEANVLAAVAAGMNGILAADDLNDIRCQIEIRLGI